MQTSLLPVGTPAVQLAPLLQAPLTALFQLSLHDGVATPLSNVAAVAGTVGIPSVVNAQPNTIVPRRKRTRVIDGPFGGETNTSLYEPSSQLHRRLCKVGAGMTRVWLITGAAR